MNKKSIKKGGALFLALFLFLLSFLPLNAYALDGAGSGAPSGGADAVNSVVWQAYKSDGTIFKEYTGTGGYTDTTVKQKELDKLALTFDYYGNYSTDKLLGLSIPFRSGRYWKFNATLSLYDKSNGNQYLSGYSYSIKYNTDNSEYSYTEKASFKTLNFKNLELKSDVSSHLRIYIVLSDFEYFVPSNLEENFYFGLNDCYLSQSDKTSGFFNNIIEWLKDIVDKIKELPQAIGSFITALGDRISSFFTNLTNSISGFFTNLINNLKTWFENIGKWFADLGATIRTWFTSLITNLRSWFESLSNNIRYWFNALFNKLWWGNEAGESAYEPPVFSSGVTDVLDKIQEYIDSLDDTLNQIDNASVSVSSQIKEATNVVNSVLGVVPSAVIALITFGIVFIFSRKVVGR